MSEQPPPRRLPEPIPCIALTGTCGNLPSCTRDGMQDLSTVRFDPLGLSSSLFATAPLTQREQTGGCDSE